MSWVAVFWPIASAPPAAAMARRAARAVPMSTPYEPHCTNQF